MIHILSATQLETPREKSSFNTELIDVNHPVFKLGGSATQITKLFRAGIWVPVGSVLGGALLSKPIIVSFISLRFTDSSF